ncbi:MAG: HEAT repeat domain-containing protein, partial [Candidatus Binatia bacterium]
RHCQTALVRLQNELETVLSKYGELIFHVEKNRLLFAGEVMHQGSSTDGDVAFALFRDGILELIFQRGIDPQETNLFFRILDEYKTLPEEAEGDIVTALWEAQLPHIRYEAADNILETDSEGGVSTAEIKIDGLAETTPSQEVDTSEAWDMLVGAKAPVTASDRIKELPRVDTSSFRLTTEEAGHLEEMVRSAEERDATEEILNMMADILKDQQDEEFFDIVLEYMEEELQTALVRKNFDVSLRILVRLHQIRQLSKKSRSWALSQINKFFLKASGPDFLDCLHDIWPTMSRSQVEKARKVLILLPPKAIGTFGSMLLEARTPSVRRMLSDVIVSLASRDFQPFENLLNGAEEDLLHRLVPLLGRMDCEKSTQILIKMAHDPSERIRKEALRAVLTRDLWVPEKLISLIDDESSFIRELLTKYLGSRRSEAAEGLLLNYLRNRRFRGKDSEHLFASFRALGRCGTARSIPFLRDTLLRGDWISRFRGSIRRKSAAFALVELGMEKAKEVLEEASRSRFRGIRSAAQAVI